MWVLCNQTSRLWRLEQVGLTPPPNKLRCGWIGLLMQNGPKTDTYTVSPYCPLTWGALRGISGKYHFHYNKHAWSVRTEGSGSDPSLMWPECVHICTWSSDHQRHALTPAVNGSQLPVMDAHTTRVVLTRLNTATYLPFKYLSALKMSKGSWFCSTPRHFKLRIQHFSRFDPFLICCFNYLNSLRILEPVCSLFMENINEIRHWWWIMRPQFKVSVQAHVLGRPLLMR